MYFGLQSLEAETSIIPTNKNQSVFDYPGMMLAALTLCPQGRKVLMLGLGGGVLPSLFQKFLPQYSLTVVEIDFLVCELAQTFFGFNPGGNVELVVDDGRHYLENLPDNSYDQIWLDAFSGDYVPKNLMGKIFLELCQDKLTPNGILVQNLHQSRTTIFQNQLRTTFEVFPEIFAFEGRTSANAVVISQKPGPSPSNWKLPHLISQAKIIGPVVGPYNLVSELDKIKKFTPDPSAEILD